MYIVKNIANDRFKGALFRRDRHFGATMHPLSLRLEPWIGGKQLKLGGFTYLSDTEYEACRDVINVHVTGNVIEVEKLDPIVIEAEVPSVVEEEVSISLPPEEPDSSSIPEVQIEVRETPKPEAKGKKKRE